VSRMGSPYRQFPFRKQPDNEAPADLIPDNGQVERMNRTIKDATVKRYFYETHDQLRAHLRDFVDAYNLRQTPQNPQGPHPIRIRLQSLDFTASEIQTQPAPANAGTKHLAYRRSGFCCPNTSGSSWSRTRIAVVLRGHTASAVELKLTFLDSLCPTEQRQESTLSGHW
jgi:Integrase core domain